MYYTDIPDRNINPKRGNKMRYGIKDESGIIGWIYDTKKEAESKARMMRDYHKRSFVVVECK